MQDPPDARKLISEPKLSTPPAKQIVLQPTPKFSGEASQSSPVIVSETKNETYKRLSEKEGLFLPTSSRCSIEYMQQLCDGRKKRLKKSEIVDYDTNTYVEYNVNMAMNKWYNTVKDYVPDREKINSLAYFLRVVSTVLRKHNSGAKSSVHLPDKAPLPPKKALKLAMKLRERKSQEQKKRAKKEKERKKEQAGAKKEKERERNREKNMERKGARKKSREEMLQAKKDKKNEENREKRRRLREDQNRCSEAEKNPPTVSRKRTQPEPSLPPAEEVDPSPRWTAGEGHTQARSNVVSSATMHTWMIREYVADVLRNKKSAQMSELEKKMLAEVVEDDENMAAAMLARKWGKQARVNVSFDAKASPNLNLEPKSVEHRMRGVHS